MHRLRLPLVGIVAVVAGVFPATTPASSEIPGACIPNAARLVSPGCPRAATNAVLGVTAPVQGLPNLTPDVPLVEVEHNPYVDEEGNVQQGPPLLRFSVAVRNFGAFALDVQLDSIPSDPTAASVGQCISWTDRACRERVPAGGTIWHADHGHFHFTEFARYDLRRLTADGQIDRTDAGIIQTAPKVSFCLMDFEPARDDAPPPFYTQCQGLWQGISPGWADVYSNYLPGQALSVEGLADGLYGLVVTIDPGGHLRETDPTDNEAALVVELFDNGSKARIVAPAS